MDVQALRDAIAADKKQGLHPFAVVAAFGTTSTCAIDSLREIGALCQDTQLWLHVDAAYAGTALILPEYRYLADGIEFVDSFAFNPNKWMFTNFDCTCFYTKQYELLRETLRIEPSYLKPLTEQKVTNYRDVSIPLGRRFRALKLWFVLRSYGVKGIQEKLRLHIQLAQWFRESIDSHPDFELVLEPVLNVICFRFHPSGSTKNDTELDELNRKLLRRLNQSGELYLSGTLVHNVFALRFVPAQTYVAAEHVSRAFDKILATAASL